MNELEQGVGASWNNYLSVPNLGRITTAESINDRNYAAMYPLGSGLSGLSKQIIGSQEGFKEGVSDIEEIKKEKWDELVQLLKEEGKISSKNGQFPQPIILSHQTNEPITKAFVWWAYGGPDYRTNLSEHKPTTSLGGTVNESSNTVDNESSNTVDNEPTLIFTGAPILQPDSSPKPVKSEESTGSETNYKSTWWIVLYVLLGLLLCLMGAMGVGSYMLRRKRIKNEDDSTFADEKE